MTKLDMDRIPDNAPVARDGKRNGDNYTLRNCFETGVRHFAYSWAKSPWGHWTAEQIDAYNEGYESAKVSSRVYRGG